MTRRALFRTLAVLPVGGLLVIWAAQTVQGRASLSADESVLVFPTYGFANGNGGWRVRLHAWVFELERDSKKREVAMDVIRRRLGIGSGELDRSIFRSRLEHFLADNERGKRLPVLVGDIPHQLPPTEANGHSQDSLNLPPAAGSATPASTPASVTLRIDGGAGRYEGSVALVPPRGITVISDIDDTIKISQVRVRQELIANTFARPFRPAPGVADVYQRWAQAGYSFHYVSGSPWQLYPPLAAFLHGERFPVHSIHLRFLRPKDKTLFEFLRADQVAYKLGHIVRIAEDLPQRRLVLVGDSGERDPEIYAQTQRRFAPRVLAVLIRDVSDEPRSAPRYRSLVAAAAKGKFCFVVFREGAELSALKFDVEGPARGCPA